MLRNRRLLIVFGLLFATSGCMATARGSVSPMQPLAVAMDASSIAHFVFSGPTETNKVQLVSSARSAVYAGVGAAGIFRSLQSTPDGAAYALTVNVTEVITVSTAARILVGALAGRNRVAGNVSVTELASGRTVVSFFAVGESAAHPYSSEAGTQEAVSAFAQQVVTGLRK